ncbi:uncharacterized protein LOC136028418 isoform X2 [Artemia franciscana]
MKLLAYHTRLYQEITVAIILDYVRKNEDRMATIIGIVKRLDLPASLNVSIGKQLKRLLKINKAVEQERSNTPETQIKEELIGTGFKFDPFAKSRLPITSAELEDLRHIYNSLYKFFSRTVVSSVVHLPHFTTAVALVSWDCYRGYYNVHGNSKIKPAWTQHFLENDLCVLDEVSLKPIKKWYGELQLILIQGLNKIPYIVKLDLDYATATFHYKDIVDYGRIEPKTEKYQHVCFECKKALKSGSQLNFACSISSCYFRKPSEERERKLLPVKAFSTELTESDLSESEWKQYRMEPGEALLRFAIEETLLTE